MRKIKQLVMPVLILLGFHIQAQNWQWAKQGGGNHSPGSNNPPWESKIWDMVTDKWGNVYTVGSVFSDAKFSGTNDTFPYYGADDACIVKWDKCGNYKWAIMNGGFQGDWNTQIAVDTEGNIYVGAYMLADNTYPVHVHKTLTTDTLLRTSKFTYMKYDPNGNLLWQQSGSTNCFPFFQGLKVMSDGNIMSLISCPAGTWQGLTTTAASSFALIVLDGHDGHMLRSAIVDTFYASGSGIVQYAPVMDDNDNIYLPIDMFDLTSAGSADILFLNQSITIPQYGFILSKIDKNLSLVNYKFATYAPAFTKLSYSQGYLYSFGALYPGGAFETDTIINLPPNLSSAPRIYKLDTANLNIIWVSKPSYEQYDGIYGGYSAVTTDNIYMVETITGKTVWGNDSVTTSARQALFKFNKEDGVCTKIYIDSGTNIHNMPTMVTSDGQGNIFIGGTFDNQFYTAHDTLVPTGGTQSPDFFVMKWGLDCNDSVNTIDRPVAPAQLLATGSGLHTIHVEWDNVSPYRISYRIYRSSNGLNNWTLIDTVLQGQTSYNDINLPGNTVYWYKVAAWNNSGESDFTNIDSAQTDQLSAIEEVVSSSMRLYPNPAKEQLNLEITSERDSEVEISVSDLTGSVLMRSTYMLLNGVNNKVININELAAGYYQVTVNFGGYSSTKKIIKM